MYNPWYTQNETHVGPLGTNNELTLDVNAFLKYTQLVKSSQNWKAHSGQTSRMSVLTDESLREALASAPPEQSRYMLNEFMVGRTRMRYYDDDHYLGFAAGEYTSSSAVQNIERLVIHPDIGYYLDQSGSKIHSDFTRKYSPQEALSRVLASPLFNGNNTKTILQSSKSERYYQLTFPLENCGRMYVLAAPMLPCYSVLQPWSHICRLFQINPLAPPARFVVPIEKCPQWRFLHRYNVKYAILLAQNLSLMNRRDPVIQEGSIEVITTLFAYDNCDADIQFNNPYGCYNKHEDYDGDTNTHGIGKGVESQTEICYNMKRQVLPCLRSKSIVPQNMLSRLMMYFLVGKRFADERNVLADERNARTDVTRVLRSTRGTNLLWQNYREYKRLLANQHNPPCWADERGGDTTVDTDDDTDDDTTESESSENESKEKTRRTDKTKDTTTKDTTNRQSRYDVADDLPRTKSIFGLELFRRVCVCMAHMLPNPRDENRRKEMDAITTRVFRKPTYGRIYQYYLEPRWWSILNKMQNFAREYVLDPQDPEKTYYATRNLLHEVNKLWAPVSTSSMTNCQTMIDDVFRSIYCLFGENECTAALDHCSRVVHEDYPHFFLGAKPFDLEYIVNVFSRAKGDFDSLLKMHLTLYERFREEARERTAEASRSTPLALGNRDLLRRVPSGKLQQHIDYADKYVLGSKRIPKSCKQANSMKWALQNIQYCDGDLWMNGRRIITDITRHFSPVLFTDVNMMRLVLADGAQRARDRANRADRSADRAEGRHPDRIRFDQPQ